MSERPYFSLFGPAIRPQYYEDVYNNVSDGNDIPFEVVFVGNVPPTKTMPDNFRYIYSDKSPAQCWDIAARETNGVLMISTVDDLRYNKNFLNRLYYYTTIFDLDKTLISVRYSMRYRIQSKDITYDESGFVDLFLPYSPTIGICALFRKDLWIKLGGFDNRFFGPFVDIDMMLRYYYELGISSFIVPDCVAVEVPLSEGHDKGHEKRLIKRSQVNPRLVLNSFWVKDGIFSRKRLLPVESF